MKPLEIANERAFFKHQIFMNWFFTDGVSPCPPACSAWCWLAVLLLKAHGCMLLSSPSLTQALRLGSASHWCLWLWEGHGRPLLAGRVTSCPLPDMDAVPPSAP